MGRLLIGIVPHARASAPGIRPRPHLRADGTGPVEKATASFALLSPTAQPDADREFRPTFRHIYAAIWAVLPSRRSPSAFGKVKWAHPCRVGRPDSLGGLANQGSQPFQVTSVLPIQKGRI